MRAFDVPEHVEMPDDAAKEALADLIAHSPEMDVGAMLRLSNDLLVSRDLATPDAVIFDIDSLSEFYRVTRSEMIMAARLCGARSFPKGIRTFWADEERATFLFDATAINKQG